MTRSRVFIGRALRAARLRLGLSQREVAARVGVTSAALSRWETGTHQPRAVDLLRLAEVLRVEIGSLVGEAAARKTAPAAQPATYAADSGLSAAERVAEPTNLYVADEAGGLRLPLVSMGHIAGTTDAEPIEEGAVEVSSEQYRLADLAIRVHGESMRPYFEPGDLVGVRRQKLALSGQIVLARVEGEFTLKRLLKISRGWFYLQPLNPDYEPIVSREVEILGVYRWLIRLRPEGRM